MGDPLVLMKGWRYPRRVYQPVADSIKHARSPFYTAPLTEKTQPGRETARQRHQRRRLAASGLGAIGAWAADIAAALADWSAVDGSLEQLGCAGLIRAGLLLDTASHFRHPVTNASAFVFPHSSPCAGRHRTSCGWYHRKIQAGGESGPAIRSPISGGGFGFIPDHAIIIAQPTWSLFPSSADPRHTAPCGFVCQFSVSARGQSAGIKYAASRPMFASSSRYVLRRAGMAAHLFHDIMP
ncbi:hypothetical protein, partial [Candidatus Amarolinea dominans]|uniref:hypothetical protein n=1 Tax=Candidatus Amarolinea dominans TaxID=3140696 RepID=UPI0031CC394A